MTNPKDIEELGAWWWSLTDKEREEKRLEFLEKVRTDPAFAKKVRLLTFVH